MSPRSRTKQLARAFTVAFLILLMAGQFATVAAQQGLTYNTLRVYGYMNEGAGAPDIVDPFTGLLVEDRPYTEADAPFLPQHDQAPIKDSVTWNPAWMYENQTFDENQPSGLYNRIYYGGLNGSEKVWFREWYEPDHWDKDLNGNGVFDETDEHYPAIMQEFTYLLMEPRFAEDVPLPVWGRVGPGTSFVFPVGMDAENLFNGAGNIDTVSDNARFGYGLTSLDGDFDGEPDIVYLESEMTLFDQTDIAADFNGSGTIEPLDLDAIPLNGNEMAVLRLAPKPIARNGYVQFLDHVVRVADVFDNGVELEIWYTGDLMPRRFNRTVILESGDMALAGDTGPAQKIQAVVNGGPGTNMCNFPTGPWFVYVSSVDTVEETARLMVGRAVGRTFSGMENPGGGADRRAGDPWFIKRFYVDGHEYNVTAIYTRNGTDVVIPNVCNLDLQPADGINDFGAELDPTEFQYITLRTPIPKVPTLIEQHSVNLQHYEPLDFLSVLPPYNHEHYILGDIQIRDNWPTSYTQVDFIGPLIGPVPPILQQDGPFPYAVDTGVRQTTWSDAREMYHFYVRELPNPQYTGQLLELYGEEPGLTTEDPDVEYWYAMRYHTRPDQYTEFVFPDIRESITDPYDPDLYLLTSAFIAPQAEYERWIYPDIGPERWTYDRVKFWYDPAIGGKKYKDDLGVRIYGRDSEGAGDPAAVDPVNAAYPVEVPPYTDPFAVFNPQSEQAPTKDILTFNPIYMYEYDNGREPLRDLYGSISIEEQNAAEKVFFRMWYEPEYLDKILRPGGEEYRFPALVQEFTYMFLDVNGNPSHGQPGNSHFIFPVSTKADQLPAPVDVELPTGLLRSFGYGLTSFDANWDGIEDIVTVHSENSLEARTGISADLDGNGVIDYLMTQEGDINTPLNGHELVVFTVEGITINRGESAQFLDYMVSFENAPNGGSAWLKFWYTGGGLHPHNGEYWIHPDEVGSINLGLGEMAIVNRQQILRLTPTNPRFGQTVGAWFCWVEAINSTQPGRETVNVTIGRALGGAHSAIDNGAAQHDLEPGDPWYLKRFFVDGHEYNVVAIRVVPADIQLAGDEPYEFKFITIRTPVPKLNFVNREDTQKLEGYFLGPVLGVNSDIISVMPPYNYEHTTMVDIEDFIDEDCVGDLRYNVPPLVIEITEEEREPQFWGELKEILYLDTTVTPTQEIWSTEMFRTLPDQYTEMRLPPGELYLLTLDWVSLENEDLVYETCDFTPTVPITTVVPYTMPRVQFWYDPTDPYDIYVNDEAVSCLPETVTGIVQPYQGQCLATHTILTSGGATIYVRDMTGLLSAYNGQLVRISGCLYDTIVCEPGIQINNPGDIVPLGPLTPTPTMTSPVTRTPTRTPTATRTGQPTATPTSTPTATTTTGPGGPTQTPLPGTGHVSGMVQLEGRVDYSGANVSMPGLPGKNATTNADGSFTIFNVPVGVHTIVADIHKYLFSQKSDVVVTAGNTTMLPDSILRGGDSNDDDTVDIFDLVILGLSYNSTPVDPDWDERGDINNDNAVNLWDLVLVGTNYNKTAPTGWSLLMAPKSQAVAVPAKAELTMGVEGSDLILEIKVADATDVYGAEVEIAFDPRALQARDADIGRSGVQLERGEIFAAENAYVVENVVDNEAGVARYAVTLLRPAEAFSGDGVVARIRFRGQGMKKTVVSLRQLSLYSKTSNDIQTMSDQLFYKLSATETAPMPPMFLKDN